MSATIDDAATAIDLPEPEAYALEQYEKIIRFRDEILAGKHATIKPLLRGDATSVPSPNEIRNSSAAGQASASIVQNGASHASPPTGPKAMTTAGKSAIVLTKAQEAVRAECQQQRRRIELSLQNFLAQDRHKQKATALQGAINASAVLAAARVLVPEITFTDETAKDIGASKEIGATKGQESDSFDDNTFYSSQYDTPEFQPASPAVKAKAPPVPAARVPATQQSTPSTAAASHAAESKVQDDGRNISLQRPIRKYDELTEPPAPKLPQNAVPGLNNYINKADASLGQSKNSLPTTTAINARVVASSQTSASKVAPTQPSTSKAIPAQPSASKAIPAQPSASKAIPTQPSAPKAIPTQPSSYIDLHPPSPLLQNKSTVSSLPSQTNKTSQVPKNNEIPGLQGRAQGSAHSARVPAPVAALRSQPASRTSTETSSQSGPGKRKNKKKKRKSDRQALQRQQHLDMKAHQIKTEPRSPSPVAGPSYLRPNKRQKKLKPQAANNTYDEMAYDPAMPSVPNNSGGGMQQRIHQHERQPTGYEDTGYEGSVYSGPGASMRSNARVSREYVAERVIADDGRRMEYPRQPSLAVEHSARSSHMARPVSQIASHADVYRDGSLYRNSPQTARYSAHPGGDGFQESVRPQPTRILVDAYGREYIEPVRQFMRHSVAPSPLPVEADRLFDRAAPQAVSRFHAPSAFDQGGYMYTQPTSPYNGPRRVVTQPEYLSFDPREGQYREYSSRPVPMAGPFVPLYADDRGGTHMGRASSMHPIEQTRLPSGSVSYGHGADVRPEGSSMMYGVERDAGPSGIKMYGSWSGNHGLVEGEGGGVYSGAAPNNVAGSGGLGGTEGVYRHDSRPGSFR